MSDIWKVTECSAHYRPWRILLFMECNSEIVPSDSNSLMLEGSPKAASVSHSCVCIYISQNAPMLVRKALWCLYLDFGSETPHSNHKGAIKTKKLANIRSWLSGAWLKTAPGCPRLSSHSLCSAPCTYSGETCQNINSAVVFFPLSVLLGPSLPCCEKPFQSVLLSL